MSQIDVESWLEMSDVKNENEMAGMAQKESESPTQAQNVASVETRMDAGPNQIASKESKYGLSPTTTPPTKTKNQGTPPTEIKTPEVATDTGSDDPASEKKCLAFDGLTESNVGNNGERSSEQEVDKATQSLLKTLDESGDNGDEESEKPAQNDGVYVVVRRDGIEKQVSLEQFVHDNGGALSKTTSICNAADQLINVTDALPNCGGVGHSDGPVLMSTLKKADSLEVSPSENIAREEDGVVSNEVHNAQTRQGSGEIPAKENPNSLTLCRTPTKEGQSTGRNSKANYNTGAPIASSVKKHFPATNYRSAYRTPAYGDHKYNRSNHGSINNTNNNNNSTGYNNSNAALGNHWAAASLAAVAQAATLAQAADTTTHDGSHPASAAGIYDAYGLGAAAAANAAMWGAYTTHIDPSIYAAAQHYLNAGGSLPPAPGTTGLLQPPGFGSLIGKLTPRGTASADSTRRNGSVPAHHAPPHSSGNRMHVHTSKGPNPAGATIMQAPRTSGEYNSGGDSTPYSIQPFLVAAPEAIERGSKYLCTFFVGIDDDTEFCVARRIIGPQGRNMRNCSMIVPGGKVRLRGKGSGFMERESGRESTEPLQINVSVPSAEGYLVAKHILANLLEEIYRAWKAFCGATVDIRLCEHPRNKEVTIEFEEEYRRKNPIFKTKRAHAVNTKFESPKKKEGGSAAQNSSTNSLMGTPVKQTEGTTAINMTGDKPATVKAPLGQQIGHASSIDPMAQQHAQTALTTALQAAAASYQQQASYAVAAAQLAAVTQNPYYAGQFATATNAAPFTGAPGSVADPNATANNAVGQFTPYGATAHLPAPPPPPASNAYAAAVAHHYNGMLTNGNGATVHGHEGVAADGANVYANGTTVDGMDGAMRKSNRDNSSAVPHEGVPSMYTGGNVSGGDSYSAAHQMGVSQYGTAFPAVGSVGAGVSYGSHSDQTSRTSCAPGNTGFPVSSSVSTAGAEHASSYYYYGA